MMINVVKGEREDITECIHLGEFILTEIPPLVAGAARIVVKVSNRRGWSPYGRAQKGRL